MNSTKPLSLLLIEDDVAECVKFKDCANRRNDITFVGMTGSSFEGLDLVKNHLPEGVILDLELHNGKGSGLQFLEAVKEAKLSLRPLIIVTTNVMSGIVYNSVHVSGADLIFYKGQADYSPDMVVNSILALRKSVHSVKSDGLPVDMQSIEAPEERRLRIMDRIDTELDLIGVGAHLKGRKYLQEAIYFLLSADTDSSDSVIMQLSIDHKHAYSSIARAMQTAINAAWQSSSIEDLQVHYTARINYRTGVPSPTEFIYFYASKIRKTM